MKTDETRSKSSPAGLHARSVASAMVEGLLPVENEHPEDKANRVQAEKEAAAAVDLWMERNRDKLRRLVAAYDDAESLSHWEDIREDFWTTVTEIAAEAMERDLETRR